ncbi:hypothetical protein ACFFX0_10650 [Citricoccus parietis]|uniref:Uncharacterized protein n=1 Tax=Citricoccus parietis TaxID=592307 RepID=A0ABV5FY78_9MICC
MSRQEVQELLGCDAEHSDIEVRCELPIKPIKRHDGSIKLIYIGRGDEHGDRGIRLRHESHAHFRGCLRDAQRDGGIQGPLRQPAVRELRPLQVEEILLRPPVPQESNRT